MAFPGWVAAGTLVEGLTGVAVTPAPNASHAAGDYEVCVFETNDEAVTLATANGFTQHPGSPVSAPGAALLPTRLTVFERIWDGSAGSPVSDTTARNHTIGVTFSLRRSSGTWANLAAARSATLNIGYASSSETVEDTTGVWPDLSSAESIDYLLLGLTAHSKPDIAGGTAELSAITNAGLGSVTERFDDAAASGNGGWIGAFTGTKTGGGAPGTTSYTKATASYKAHLVIALRDSAPASPQTVTITAAQAISATLPAPTILGRVNPGVQVISATLPAPAITQAAGPQTVSPGALVVAATLPAPKVGQEVRPGALVVSVSPVAPTRVSGRVRPGVLVISATLPAPKMGQEVRPGALVIAATLPAPTIKGRVLPASLTVSATLPSPSITQAGAGTVSPSALVISATLPALKIGQEVRPGALVISAVLPAPAIGQEVRPATLVIAATLPAPSIGKEVRPATLVIAATLPAPSIGKELRPGTLTIAATLPSPKIGQELRPAALVIGATLPAPRVGAAQGVSPATLVISASLPAPSVVRGLIRYDQGSSVAGGEGASTSRGGDLSSSMAGAEGSGSASGAE